MKNGFVSIIKYAAPFKKSFIIGCIFSVACAVIKLFIPIQIRGIMNYLQENINGTYDFAVINKLTIVGLILMVGSFLLESIESVILSGSAQKMSHSLKNRLNEKLDRLPLAYFINRPAGDLQSCMTNDVDAISTAVSNNASAVISSFATIIVCLVVMFKINVILTIVTILNSLIGVVISLVFMKKSKPYMLK